MRLVMLGFILFFVPCGFADASDLKTDFITVYSIAVKKAKFWKQEKEMGKS